MAASAFAPPPRLANADGEPRRVGVEIEFAGIPLRDVADAIVDLFGGARTERDRFRWVVEGSELGDFTLTVDAQLLQDRKYVGVLEKLGLGGLPALERFLADTLELIVSPVVPFEIVTGPLALDALPRLEELRARLHDMHARGTGASWLLGVGLHLNPEVPDREVATLRDVLRAYLLLADWLRETGRTDPTRRLLPFITPFPDEYRRLVLDPAYEPDATALIDDYLAWNATRNRPLDLLPVLATIDRERVIAGAEEPELVRARPTFHYRLPDCRLDEPEWTIAAEWNRWVAVERLAADPGRLRAASEAYLDRPGVLRRLLGPPWSKRVEEWIEEPAADG